MSLADLRREYAHARLDEREVDPDPMVQFRRWFDDARRAGLLEPNAMTLATATPDGVPSARIVLLKAADELGFVFYTDYRSRKGQDLELNPRGALVFYWGELERQLRITGSVSRVSQQESEVYFQTRPRGSRIAAWVSEQSSVLSSRALLEDRIETMAARYPGEHVPLPPHWGGYRLRAETIEFWQGRENRLHDRVRYQRQEDGWKIERLSP